MGQISQSIDSNYQADKNILKQLKDDFATLLKLDENSILKVKFIQMTGAGFQMAGSSLKVAV